MIGEADPGLQAEMIGTDIAISQRAVHTPGLKDPHPVQGGLGDHTQETDDHPTGGEYSPHSLDRKSRLRLRSPGQSRYSHQSESHSPSRRTSSQHHQQSYSPDHKCRKHSQSPDLR